MKSTKHRLAAAAVILGIAATTYAVVAPATRIGTGIQFATGGSASNPGQGGAPTLWPDNASPSKLHYNDGTNDNSVPAIAATTKGDLAVYDGGKWVRVPAGTNGLPLLADSTQAAGVSYGAVGGVSSFQSLSSDPVSPSAGDVWYNNVGALFKGYNGSVHQFAYDDLVAHLAGAENITGAKTFQSSNTLKVNNAGNTFASTIASAATAARTVTLPDATDTLVGQSTTDTLANKTLSSPAASGTISGTYTIGGVPTLATQLHRTKQSVSFTSTPSFNCSSSGSGSVIFMQLTGNLGVWGTFTAGSDGDLCELDLQQDAGGTRTIGTPPANLVWMATTYNGATHSAPTLTTTGGKTDIFVFVYNTALAKWVEIARSMAN